LPRHHLLEGEAAQAAPSRDEEQRPGKAIPAGKVGVGHQGLGAPGLDGAADGQPWIAEDVDEARVGKGGGQERHAQRVARRHLDQTEAPRADRRRLAVTIADPVAQQGLEVADHGGIGVFGEEAVGVEPALFRRQRRDAVEDRMALAAEGHGAGGQGQGLEEQRGAGARWRHDEDRPIEDRHRSSWRA
jgi:hypothetical protein